MKRILIILFLFVFGSIAVAGQDITPLINQLRAKLDEVNDYVATGKMKTNVVFIKAPLSNIKVFYKKPDHFRLKKNGGISILPKGGITVNMRSVLDEDHYLAIAAGTEIINGIQTKVVKLLPDSDTGDIVLTTLYIDVPDLLIRRAVTTTRDNGTFQVDLFYGIFARYGLPDKVIFSFDAREYKLPKGITLEFGPPGKNAAENRLKGRKGEIEITYDTYIINKGVPDADFL